MDNTDIIKGTARWYEPANGPGKFALKKEISAEIPFKHKEEVIIEINKITGVVCIKGL